MNGNILQQQVEKGLKDKGWEVSSEDFYTDPNTQKPREKDIIAKKHQDNHNYDVFLFIECKTIPEETIIEEKEQNNNEKNMIVVSGISHAKIEELENNKKIHLCQYQKFFKSKDNKDFLYTAVNQNLQSFSAFRKNHNQGGLYYLIIVHDNNVFYLDDSNQKQICDNALIKVGTLDDTFNLPHQKCFIETISLSNLEKLLQEIENDIVEINASASFYRQMEQDRLEQNRRDIIADNDFGY